jgi:hypothetical protein
MVKGVGVLVKSMQSALIKTIFKKKQGIIKKAFEFASSYIIFVK